MHKKETATYKSQFLFVCTFCPLTLRQYIEIKSNKMPAMRRTVIGSFKNVKPNRQGIKTEYETISDVIAIDPDISARYPKVVLKKAKRPYAQAYSNVGV